MDYTTLMNTARTHRLPVSSLPTPPRALIEPLESRQLLSVASIDMDAGWKFAKGANSGAQATSFNDGSWQKVSLPHTWNAQDGQDGGNNYYRGTAWYRKHFTIPTNLTGKQLYLQFDGAMLSTDVYVNGVMIGSHRGGYSAFTFDLNPYLKIGKDTVIAVKVNNEENALIAPYFSGKAPDWTKFGGLYRDVRLVAKNLVAVNPLDMGSSGVFLKQSKVSKTSAQLDITAEVRNVNKNAAGATVKTSVLDSTGKIVGSVSSPLNVAGKQIVNAKQTLTITNPHLWDGVMDPYLYTVKVDVTDAGGATDTVTQKVGFRSIAVDPQKGFLLNGRVYDLHGVSFHQDLFNKGSATTASDRAADVALVKEIGASAVRLAHYQHSQDVYDAMDKAGILVWSEIPLDANFSTDPAFTSNLTLQLQETIRQLYNHPSIFTWGLHNEMENTSAAQSLVTTLHNVAKAEDPTRLTSGANNDWRDSYVLSYKTDLNGFNKYFGWYLKDKQVTDIAGWLDSAHKNNKTKPIGIAEYGAGGSMNQHEPANPTPARPEAAGSFHPIEYMDYYHEQMWSALSTRPWVWGKFVWSMFDFASDWRNEGESAGINDKGLITYDRKTKKDPFYFYKANWTKSPVNYITSRTWTARTAAVTDVKAYSNMDSVTLSVNGTVIGTQVPSSIRVARWAGVTLQPGANTVTITGTKNGQTYTDTVTWTLGGARAMVASATPAAGGSVFGTKRVAADNADQELLSDVL